MAVAADIERATDSRTDWVREHVQRYVGSGGAEGHEWRGLPTLVLATTGRSTGEPRRTALIYGTSGEDLVVVASQGGAPEDPQWYRNLQADPQAGVLVGTRRLTARARTASADERGPLWERMVAIYPTYEDYAARTDREIPIVLLTPED
ncbi:nitroreductase family deazaflavin-dependent oxidoreductase [Actinomycetospora straminea]|uniref:Nitroreductase family deazaflavin-dependent oxidoreductase n=1 Tax=Actinomycetospora straminea TaxID=663607 RepID=A0ABP9EF17_9PSEU|nr:nitroreductase family deazaflavin-dependent oxidoreductase [Actinomycetospora straminea]MDD7934561.1 nitroreductase family deazaflavin-dependent oxidoreductase [Actinomycetospora straminea]